MFSRVIYEEWHNLIPIAAFLLTFSVFAFFFVRALFIKKAEAEYLAQLPLQQDPDHS